MGAVKAILSIRAGSPQGGVQAWLRSLLDYHLPQARAALREAGAS